MKSYRLDDLETSVSPVTAKDSSCLIAAVIWAIIILL